MRSATTSDELRAHNRARLLRVVHDSGASLTRSEVTRRLGMSRGTASVLVAELTRARLLAESPPQRAARGRPTRIPGPHPDGPVVVAAEVREDFWRVARGELGGGVAVVESNLHDGVSSQVFGELTDVLSRRIADLAPRVVGVGLSVAGPVRDGRLFHISHLDWRELDVGELLRLETPVFPENDATLAGLAEARRGALRGVDAAIHLHVDFDVGGSLLADGRAVRGTRGVAGEFGHMPLSGGDAPCPCGATGCWSLNVGTNALLRGYGLDVDYRQRRRDAKTVLDRADRGDAAARVAVEDVAAAMGRGIGALVNAHDPRTVTVSGFGVDLMACAGDLVRDSCRDALMSFHRDAPPDVVPSAIGPDGPLIGAAETVFDEFLTSEGLRGWMAAQD
ncbi:MAG: ROK family transcriptional regulator [Stackebrandtia sp.]